MIDDYERRFQRSLQKLPIPSWFTIDPNASSSRCSSKQSIVSHTVMTGPSRQPRSYRSCRSSLATSPSPSIRSWHPNYLADRMTLTHRHVSSSSRRQPTYEKGIQRVSKSSHWYQPTKFVLSQNNIDKGDETLKNSTLTQIRPSNCNHYDTPKVSQTTNQFINIQTNNNVIKNEKDYVASNLMSEMKQTSMSIKSQIPSLESIPLVLKRHDQMHNDDTNTGVREIFEDENGLRELDESEINDTDEFFVFAPDVDDEHSLSTSNRLYTFAKFSEPSNDNSKQNHSDQNHQDSSGVDKQLEAMNLPLSDDHSNYQEQSRPIDYWCKEKLIDPLSAQLVNHSSSFDGVNEETVRIGRILLQSIPTSYDEDNHYSIPKSNPNFQWTEPPTTIEELQGFPVDNEEEFLEDIQHDSGYSSNHERFPLPVSIYEHLLDCYSGSSLIQNDLITTNLSSITDEAYESEPTTVSSSIATTITVAHVHPDLEHEFEYPSPPPPVPDRRLKPAHLRTPPMSKQESIDSSSYTSVQKTTSVPKTTIEHLIASTSNEVCSTPVKTMSSRHYCGSIPVAREPPLPTKDSLSAVKTPTTKEKRVSKTLNCLHSSAANDDHDKSFAWIKSSSSSYRNKTKKQTKTQFDEATNGLAIRLPAPSTNGHQTTPKSTLQSHPKSTSTKCSTSIVTKTGSIKNEFKPAVRLPIYETSV